MVKMRFDVLICFVLAGLLTAGAGRILPGVYSMLYDRYQKTHTAADGEIGGRAGEDVYLAQSVEDMLSHDSFTFQIESASFKTADAGCFGETLLNNLALPSGERVAVSVNYDTARITDDEDYYIMPVGRVVEADLSEDPRCLTFMEKYNALSRTDFYVDMQGSGPSGLAGADSYDEKYTLYIEGLTAVSSFFLFHFLGVKLGLFPRFLTSRKKRKQEEG